MLVLVTLLVVVFSAVDGCFRGFDPTTLKSQAKDYEYYYYDEEPSDGRDYYEDYYYNGRGGSVVPSRVGNKPSSAVPSSDDYYYNANQPGAILPPRKNYQFNAAKANQRDVREFSAESSKEGQVWPDGNRYPVAKAPSPVTGNAEEPRPDALETVLQSLTAGDIAILPIETLRQIPTSTLSQLPPDVLATLPEEILAKLSVDSHVKAVALGDMIKFLPVDKVVQLPWLSIIRALPAKSMNSFSPTVIGAIPWDDVLPLVPATAMGGLSASVLQLVPPTAWRGVSYESLEAVKPSTLSQLPLSSLAEIWKSGNLQKLGPDRLAAFSKDVLDAIAILASQSDYAR